jgi:hypothetical protein
MMSYKVIILFFLTTGLCTNISAAEKEKNIYQGDLESRINALTSIQPGLGVVMHEIGYRNAAMYWAANGGNWGLAQYELKELLEAQEVGEITRPKFSAMLKAFENDNLLPLGKAIVKKDIKLFNQRFTTTVRACNGCHTATGHGFIKYQVPSGLQHGVLDYNLKTEPAYKEKKNSN